MADARLPWQHIALALFLAACWGSVNGITKHVVDNAPALASLTFRFSVTALLLAPTLRQLSRAQWRTALQIAAVAGPVHFSLLYLGFSMADRVSSIAIVILMWIPFATLLAIPVLREWPRAWTSAGLVLAFGGVAIMGFDPTVLQEGAAVVFILGAAFCWGLSAVISRRLPPVPALPLQAVISLVTIPAAALLSLLLESGQMAAIQGWLWPFIGWNGLCSVLGGIIGNGLLFWLVRRHPVALVTPYTLTAPFFSIAMGIFWLGESLTLRIIAGVAVTFCGLLVITLRQRQRTLEALEQPDADRA